MALVVVVLGHLLLAVIDRDGHELRGANLLELRPQWAAVGAFAPMPIFFAAAGWANATTTLSSAAGRLRQLVGTGAVVVCLWSLAVIVAVSINGSSGVIGDGARIATQPLWFIAAYLPFAAIGKPFARFAADLVLPVTAAALAMLAILDVTRFGLGAPDWIGWPGFFVAWGTPWMVGAWWRDRLERGLTGEASLGAMIAITAGAACVALVAFAGYDPALIDAVRGARSNTTPPTLYTATAALAQTGLLIACAGLLDRAGRRWRRLWQRAGDAAVGIYVWHLTALAVCAAVIAAGLPVPERLTVVWWITRPVWWAFVLAVTGGLVLLTGAARSRLDRRATSRRACTNPPPATNRAIVGVLLAAVGAAVVGLRGPRTVSFAIVCAVTFLAGWFLLRPRLERRL